MRRSSLLLVATTFVATTAICPAFAQEEPLSIKLVELVYASDFRGAASIMRKMVEKRPLDRNQRLILGQFCFGDGDFAAAADEFQRIEKRGGTRDDFGVVDIGELVAVGSSDKTALLAGSRFKDSATWLHLSLLRQGNPQTTTLLAGPRESIRALLRGDTTKDEYVDLQWQAMNSVLGAIADRYGDNAEVAEMVKIAQRNLRAELTCVADFALGEQALGSGDRKGAADHLRAALDTKARRIVEFHIAKTELQRLS